MHYRRWQYTTAVATNHHRWCGGQSHRHNPTFHTFLDLDSVIYLAVNRTVTSLSVLIQNIINCVPKMNYAFKGLEWQNYHFGVEYPFKQIFPHRDEDVMHVWMRHFRGTWTSLNFDKEYLFGFETLVFATSGILSMHNHLVTLQRERKTWNHIIWPI